MKRFLKWLDEDLEETILMVLLVAIAVVMMAQVVMRYCFRQSMPWPEEFCRFCFVYSGFISMGYCVRRGKMLKVDILVGFFPQIVQIHFPFHHIPRLSRRCWMSPAGSSP